MRTTYIGSDDEESGFFSAGHVYNATPFEISDEVIEEGHFTSLNVRPKEGTRLVYYPKDPNDLNFQPTNLAMGYNNEGTPFVRLNSENIGYGDYYTVHDDSSASLDELEQANLPASKVSMSAIGTTYNGASIEYHARQMETHKSPSYYWG